MDSSKTPAPIDEYQKASAAFEDAARTLARLANERKCTAEEFEAMTRRYT